MEGKVSGTSAGSGLSAFIKLIVDLLFLAGNLTCSQSTALLHFLTWVELGYAVLHSFCAILLKKFWGHQLLGTDWQSKVTTIVVWGFVLQNQNTPVGALQKQILCLSCVVPFVIFFVLSLKLLCFEYVISNVFQTVVGPLSVSFFCNSSLYFLS